MPLYFNCPICHLSLPSSVAEVITVRTSQGLRRITICSNCKKKKQEEGIRKCQK